MRMMRCEKCGALLGYNEAALERVAWSDMEDPWAMECPHCGGGVGEAVYCKVCCSWKPESRMLDDHVCRDCVEKYVTAESLMSFTYAEGYTDDVEIDSGAMSILGAVGISLNDIAMKIARTVVGEPRYAARLKKMAEAAVEEYGVEEVVDFVKLNVEN